MNMQLAAVLAFFAVVTPAAAAETAACFGEESKVHQMLCQLPEVKSLMTCDKNPACLEPVAPAATPDAAAKPPAPPKPAEPVDIAVPTDTPKGYREELMIMQ